MTDLAARRKELVQSAMGKIKSIISNAGVNRQALDEAKAILVAMTQEQEMFGDAEFPTPKPDEYAKIYLVTDDEGGDFTLYLVSALPLGPSPIHDHGTFAIIAGLDGEEENTLYKRLDDGSESGRATIEEDYKIILKRGDAVAFMPQDIHHIQAISDIPTRHFHLYGKGFDQQTDRLEFKPDDGTTRAVFGSFLPVDESRRVL